MKILLKVFFMFKNVIPNITLNIVLAIVPCIESTIIFCNLKKNYVYSDYGWFQLQFSQGKPMEIIAWLKLNSINIFLTQL